MVDIYKKVGTASFQQKYKSRGRFTVNDKHISKGTKASGINKCQLNCHYLKFGNFIGILAEIEPQ